MIARTHPLPIVRQCRLLKLACSMACCQPTLALMWRIDELHLHYPFAGARMLRDLLQQEGHAIGRRQVVTLMRRMGIEALYRKPHLSRRHPADTIHPYRCVLKDGQSAGLVHADKDGCALHIVRSKNDLLRYSALIFPPETAI